MTTIYKKSGTDDMPVVIMEDMAIAGENLKKELMKRNVIVYLCVSVVELMTVASDLSRAMFAVDINMGKDRDDEGIVAIERLKALSRKRGHDFYVAALTSHAERQKAASRAGVDAFLVKQSPVTDALELVTRLSAHKIEDEKRKAQKMQAELAKEEYSTLFRQLNLLKKKKYKQSISIPATTLTRALNWPFLLPNEKLVLAALNERFQHAQSEGVMDQRSLDLCLKGVKLLVKNRAEDSHSVSDWIARVQQQPDLFIMPWVGNEDLDDEED